jgi:hypothetical protein
MWSADGRLSPHPPWAESRGQNYGCGSLKPTSISFLFNGGIGPPPGGNFASLPDSQEDWLEEWRKSGVEGWGCWSGVGWVGAQP